ncbi:MAG TPA: FAD-dependent monooxygenase [Actinophytocola sp.]|uniref:FAD-dependent monooxygenase n=1 Tax=Actinophytocola sp. TaxID=1872138 RepID=UPI002DBC8E0F|nr:FAD-dependent monooxygenase [Actinophytocola sp.]HEU5473624.1 FAD-dependent monooxygenase [Actinophytocola sp.]
MTENKSILISGASVAGPALAYWLRRFGFSPTVVERSPALREGGAAVDFRGAVHLTVLERMGLLEEIRRHRTSPKPWVFVDAAGRPKAELPADFAGGEVEIRRGDLSRILYQASCDGAEYIFGDWITSLTETAGGVEVTFRHGPPRRFDLVVGADGMHSGVRALAFGDESELCRFMGFHFASCNEAHRWTDEENVLVYNAPGLMVAPGLFVFRSGPLDYQRYDVAAQKRIVADAFAGAGWRTAELVEDMLAAPDFYLDSISHVRMEHVVRGRFALVGDAGYGATMGGMGTGLAVVGAYVLAGELAAAGGDHRIAFPAYESQLLPYARGCQGNAGRFMAPAKRSHIWQRNQLVKLITRGPVSKLIGRMDMKAATALALKDYPMPVAQGR